ncbi:universal stress protein [Actinoallomurus sp. CA-142502]|uniref:universal stress protein n=1 Tax=Actinoallomurus sp. CA-142502 TaxID=3239885 RepID=UPI003D91F567
MDGSATALYAADWAAAEAAGRRQPSRIVHVAVRWEYDVEAPAEPGTEAARPEAAGLQVLRVAEERARTLASPQVDRRLAIGPIPLTLLQEAEDAALLVLGPRGTGGFTRLLLGSVSLQVAEHAPCPVVIVPHDTDTDTRPRRAEIVVGVDGSAGPVDAVGLASEETSLRARFSALSPFRWGHGTGRGPPAYGPAPGSARLRPSHHR